MASLASETSPTAVRAPRYGGPAFYFLVTLGIGVWLFLDDLLLLAVTFVVALAGAIIGFAVLRRSYRETGYLRAESGEVSRGGSRCRLR